MWLTTGFWGHLLLSVTDFSTNNTECCCCRKEEQKHCLQTSADKFTVLVLINKSLTVTIADLSPRSYMVKHLSEIFHTCSFMCMYTHANFLYFSSSFSKGQIPGRGSPSGLGVVLPRAGFYHPAAAVLPAVLPSSLQNGCNHAVVLESGSDPAPCPQPPPAGPHAPSAPEPQPAAQGAVSSCPTGGARVP